jgi:hypothetical protein
MKIVATKSKSGTSFTAAFFMILFLAAGAYSLTIYGQPMFWPAVMVSVVSLVLYAVAQDQQELVIEIDEVGIYDRRLGVGKILWKDVEEVQLQIVEGNYYLCLKVRNPTAYAAKLQGPKRQQVMYNQRLGFKSFNVDVRALNVDLLELKRLVDAWVSKHSRSS